VSPVEPHAPLLLPILPRVHASQCRRVLKYTYVYGFYMPEGREKALFEDLQSRLEKSTEHVAELTEQPVDKINRADVVNFTRVTLNFLKNVLDGLDAGLVSDAGGDASG
jgi:ariadne-1